MKNFIKNNLKVFVAIMITTIIVGTVSVYAASQYFAKDISFIPTNENFKKENGEAITNVEDALNELYNINNKKVSIQLFENNSEGQLVLTNSIFSRYKKFKMVDMYNYNARSCIASVLNDAGTVRVNLQLNTEYNLNDLINNGYTKLGIVSTGGWCWPTFDFYN